MRPVNPFSYRPKNFVALVKRALWLWDRGVCTDEELVDLLADARVTSLHSLHVAEVISWRERNPDSAYRRGFAPPPDVRRNLQRLVYRRLVGELEDPMLYESICVPLSELLEPTQTLAPEPPPSGEPHLPWSFTIVTDVCEGIGDCVAVCPTECIQWAGSSTTRNSKGTRYAVIDDSRCISCAACTSVCPMALDQAILDHWDPERQARVSPEG